MLCDDYDLLAGGGPGPLAPFVEFLPQSRDIGFHLVLTRRSGGSGRAMYEPVPQRMKEVGVGRAAAVRRPAGGPAVAGRLPVARSRRGAACWCAAAVRHTLIQTAYADPAG